MTLSSQDVTRFPGEVNAGEERARERRLSRVPFFAGLSIEETAHVLGISIATVKRHWDFARAWLRREIKKNANDGR